MQKLNLPEYELKISSDGQRSEIFDVIRKKYVVLTPEEWVRQHIIHFLSKEKGYPISLMALESALIYNQQKKRTDVLVYNRNGNPVLLVECKAPDVKINAKVFEQISRYNMALKVNYILVTNGMQNYCCSVNHVEKGYRFMENIPDYSIL